jgi:hypothetical protein
MFIVKPGRMLRETSSGKRKVEWAVDNIKHFIITSQRATSLFGACLVIKKGQIVETTRQYS